MKNIKQILSVAFIGLTIVSCSGISKSPAENAEDFQAIEDDLKAEFGEDAYYTDLTVNYTEGVGTSTSVTVTSDPESLTMGEWGNSQGWEQSADVTLELPEGTEAKDFMFQLDEKINLSTLGELVEKSRDNLKVEKNVENPTLSLAVVSFPDNGDYSEAGYTIWLKPLAGGTTFTYSYDLDGVFLDLHY